jgi:hypothetical protein
MRYTKLWSIVMILFGGGGGMYRKSEDKETLLGDNKDFVLIVNTQKSKYRLCRHHNAGHHYNIRSDCRFLKLNYLRTALQMKTEFTEKFISH